MTSADVRKILRDKGMCGHIFHVPNDSACLLDIGHDLGAHEPSVADMATELQIARSKIGDLERMIAVLDGHREETVAQNKRLTDEKDGVYRERNRLVSALARLVLRERRGFEARAADHPGNPNPWNAWLGQHPESDVAWDPEWRTIVFIQTPPGQLSWHIHDSELALFQGIDPLDIAWDGHSTETKYQRLELVR